MDNLKINIRIIYWHLQVDENWKIKISYNSFHKELKNGWFQVYTFKLKDNDTR